MPQNPLYIGLLIGLLLVTIYILRAYINRYSIKRLTYLIKKSFIDDGDGDRPSIAVGQPVSIKSIEIQNVYSDSLVAVIKYSIKQVIAPDYVYNDEPNNTPIPVIHTSKITYDFKRNCGYTPDCIQP